jgi:hypothetical protein
MSVFALQDSGGKPFRLTPQRIMDATVLHLRQRHQYLEPQVYAAAGVT